MTDHRRKYTCPICGAAVRQIGKHGLQKHDAVLRPQPDGTVLSPS